MNLRIFFKLNEGKVIHSKRKYSQDFSYQTHYNGAVTKSSIII